MLQAQLNVEQQGIQLKYYRNQLFPELDLIGSYGFNGASSGLNGANAQYDPTIDQIGSGNAPFYSYGAQLSMPLSNVGPRNKYKSTKVTLQQILLQLKQLEQNVMVEIDNAVKQARVRLSKRGGHAAGAHLRRGGARCRTKNLRRRQGHHL